MDNEEVIKEFREKLTALIVHNSKWLSPAIVSYILIREASIILHATQTTATRTELESVVNLALNEGQQIGTVMREEGTRYDN
jgi:hypothetical protein